MNTETEKNSTDGPGASCSRYWGLQTRLAMKNFKIGSHRMPIEVIRALGIVKKAAAIANHGCGVLSREKKDLIVMACDEIINGMLDDHFPLPVWQTGSGTQSNMNVNEVIAGRCQALAGRELKHEKYFVHPNDDVNMSQSSNDTFPSAMNMAAFAALETSTIPCLKDLRKSLDDRALQWKDIIKVGRTHLMDATPVTLGQEFSGYSAMIDHGIGELEHSMTGLSELALGGTAVGTGLNVPEGFEKAAIKLICEFTGSDFVCAPNKFQALASHDAIVSAHGALRGLAAGLMKIANDIRLMGSGPRCGIGELALPENEPGSSMMPGKVNPTQAEALTMVCAQIMGNDVTMGISAAGGHFELNAFKPVIIYNFLESAHLMAGAVLSFRTKCLDGIMPVHGKIADYLDMSLMPVTALVPYIGYDRAAEIANKALAQNKTLRQAAVETGFVSSEDFDKWVVPAKMIGNK